MRMEAQKGEMFTIVRMHAHYAPVREGFTDLGNRIQGFRRVRSAQDSLRIVE